MQAKRDETTGEITLTLSHDQVCSIGMAMALFGALLDDSPEFNAVLAGCIILAKSEDGPATLEDLHTVNEAIQAIMPFAALYDGVEIPKGTMPAAQGWPNG
jgi:hypothetical protein